MQSGGQGGQRSVHHGGYLGEPDPISTVTKVAHPGACYEAASTGTATTRVPPKGCVERATRLELATFSLGSWQPNAEVPDSKGTYGDAGSDTSDSPSSSHANRSDDEDLSRVAEAWPDLPAAIRAGILAMVEAAILKE